ncbi:MAG: GNAT family protein [Roseiflexaceae bacterium]|nr:GNAT family protein [Roseiflexaceae bacterium]
MLKGSRVTLRAIDRNDLARFHELNQQVDLVLLVEDSWEPISLARREREYEKRLDDHRFAIVVDERIIGGCGLHSSNRYSGTTSFGIAILDPEYLGQGYGREAIELLLDYIFRIQNWRRVSIQMLANNERAIRCYRACGFVLEGQLRDECYSNGRYVDMMVMGLLRTEWDTRQLRSPMNT